MTKIYFLLVLSLLLAISPQIQSTPKAVIVIRHAEKIANGSELNLKGFERAAALPYYFSLNPLYRNFPISHIFASAIGGADRSQRPIQTCTPTANYYNLPLNTSFKPDETNELVEELLTNQKYDNSTVLICSSHGKIGKIVAGLGAEAPDNWTADIFDQVYLITFEDGKKPKLEKVLQKLMFGDRA